MRPDDKRKETSRLNALKSTGPKTPEGKRRSAFNSVTHGAYVQEFILHGEELSHFQLLMDAHIDSWKPTNPIEDTFVFEMVTTLWRFRRQAPAESNLMKIQMQRMLPDVTEKFDFISPSGLYALAVVELQEHGDALNQIARQGRRLLTQYEKLTQQLLTMRQLFPPVIPEPPNQQDQKPQNEPVETKLPQHHQTENQSTENETVETQLNETRPIETESAEIMPVGTKLTGWKHFPLSRETRVHNPQSILYAAQPPIEQPAKLPSDTDTQAATTVTQPQKSAAGAA